MAEVIQLVPRRARDAARGAPGLAPTTLFFDLASPFTYLVAERVERRFGEARWHAATAWHGSVSAGPAVAATIAVAERRARELRLPLVWPERFPAGVPRAMRVATFAAERGCGSAFALAAGRLAFCGGFDVEDADILAEAAAAAGLEVPDALAAARDVRRDELVGEAGRAIWVEGAGPLPVLRHEGQLYAGEPRITAVLAQAGVARPYAS